VLNNSLLETFGEVIWKYKIYEPIDKLHNTLNESTNRNELSDKTVGLSNELLETIEIIMENNCIDCEANTRKYNLDGFHNSVNIESCLVDLGNKSEWKKNCTIDKLNNKLFEINIVLNKEILCEDCKGKKIERLTDKCGNKEIARFLYYNCKLNAEHYRGYIQLIPFDEFRYIEYLAKGGFGEVHKATWINYYYCFREMKYKDRDVVLKRIYNSSDDKIVDILKEVK